MSKSNSREMARHIGLLEQLVTDLLDDKRPEIPDLTQKNSSFLSSGLKYVLNLSTTETTLIEN